jgi:hypothetical protein
MHGDELPKKRFMLRHDLCGVGCLREPSGCALLTHLLALPTPILSRRLSRHGTQ